MKAVWTYLILMITVHVLRALGYVLTMGLWAEHLSGWYHFVGLYVIVNIIINYQCIKGIQRCESSKIKNQVNILCITFPLSLVALCLVFAWHPDETNVLVLWTIVVVGSAYMAWLFREVYRWAFYFEKGGEYDAEMFRAPIRVDGRPNERVARIQRGQ